jgi:hypothetical protein
VWLLGRVMRHIHFAKKNNYHQFSFIVCRFALQRVWLLGA